MMLAATAAQAQTDAGIALRHACEQFVQTGAGHTLSFSKKEGLFVLHDMGPMESDIGRVFAMKARRTGKVVTVAVTVAERSVPASGPNGPTFRAFGSNSGAVSLPTLATGRYELSRFSLEVTDELRVTPIGKVPVCNRFMAESAVIRATPKLVEPYASDRSARPRLAR